MKYSNVVSSNEPFELIVQTVKLHVNIVFDEATFYSVYFLALNLFLVLGRQRSKHKQH